jgi:indole-3-glycerol phosphate synthase
LHNKDEILASARKAIASGYYEVPQLVHKEKKSLLEAIEHCGVHFPKENASDIEPKLDAEAMREKSASADVHFPKENASDIAQKGDADSIEKKRDAGLLPVIARAVQAESGALGGTGNDLKADLAGICERAIAAGACGVCIPVEPAFLGGDIHLLERGWNVPVLVTDFIIDERQMAGGDAMLLITALLDAAGVNQNVLIDAAHEKGFEVVLQVGSAAEFERAVGTEADMILVTGRDFWSGREVDSASVIAGSKSGRIVIVEADIGDVKNDGAQKAKAEFEQKDGQICANAKNALEAGARCILLNVPSGAADEKIIALLAGMKK